MVLKTKVPPNIYTILVLRNMQSSLRIPKWYVCVWMCVFVCVCISIIPTLVSTKKNKGIVYTMDHEVVPRPCKIYDWLLNSTWGHFNLHWGKIVRVTMESEVPKRHIWRHALSTDMCPTNLRWERQKRCSSKKKDRGPRQRNIGIIDLWWIFLGIEKMKTRDWSNLDYFNYFSKLPLFRHICKNSAHSFFWCMVFPLVPHSLYT